MAGRDNVLFHASIANGTAVGTVIPLSLQYGIENVRQGYGTPVLKNIRAYFVGAGYNLTAGIPVEIKNSNWIDSAGVVAQAFGADTSLNRDSLSFMRGRDKVLAPNTSWTISAQLPAQASAAGDIYVIIEIAYSDVAGIATENASGSPVMKKATSASVTGSANVPVSIGTFDNLLQGVSYVLSEVSLDTSGGVNTANFLIIEGFSNQKGLVRIIPCKSTGLADQIEGSVTLTKQTYNLSMIRSGATSAAAVTIGLEMIASSN